MWEFPNKPKLTYSNVFFYDSGLNTKTQWYSVHYHRRLRKPANAWAMYTVDCNVNVCRHDWHSKFNTNDLFQTWCKNINLEEHLWDIVVILKGLKNQCFGLGIYFFVHLGQTDSEFPLLSLATLQPDTVGHFESVGPV